MACPVARMCRFFLLTVTCLELAMASPGDDKPDFSGNWVLKLDQSKFGRGVKPDGMTLKVTRDGDVMHAVQTTNTSGGPTDAAGDWIVDGKEHDAAGATPEKVTTRWEGNTVYSERKSIDGSFVQRIWLSLSADGKTAHEKVLTKGADGENVSHLVWLRQ